MEFRILKQNEIHLLKQIDRSEKLDGIYYFEGKNLKLREIDYYMQGFPEGELEELLERLEVLHNNGGAIFAAFDGEKIAGMTAVENTMRGNEKDTMKMDILFVSKPYRGRGLGADLIALVKEEIVKRGGKKMYVSSTESKNTVDFYISQGCRLATELEIDPELYEMEPEDIHLILELE